MRLNRVLSIPAAATYRSQRVEASHQQRGRRWLGTPWPVAGGEVEVALAWNGMVSRVAA